MLCSLRAQIELGNFTGANMDYGEVIAHTLSPRLLTCVTHESVAMHHQSLFNMDSQEAKQAFLNLIKSWPLHRATIFDVTVGCGTLRFDRIGHIPPNCWLFLVGCWYLPTALLRYTCLTTMSVAI